MEKSYQLDQREAFQLQQLEQDRTQALAAVGALSLDMEQAKKNLDMVADRQRSFIRTALQSRGVTQFDNARAANGALIVTEPDKQAAQQQVIPAERPNGHANGPVIPE